MSTSSRVIYLLIVYLNRLKYPNKYESKFRGIYYVDKMLYICIISEDSLKISTYLPKSKYLIFNVTKRNLPL